MNRLSLARLGFVLLALSLAVWPSNARGQSAALRVFEEAFARGARVAYHDPFMPAVVLKDEVVRSMELNPLDLERVDAVVLLTPHTAGETRRYEDNVIEILRDNLGRLGRGQQQLRNQVV